jgi:hypothetical protein
VIDKRVVDGAPDGKEAEGEDEEEGKCPELATGSQRIRCYERDEPDLIEVDQVV